MRVTWPARPPASTCAQLRGRPQLSGARPRAFHIFESCQLRYRRYRTALHGPTGKGDHPICVRPTCMHDAGARMLHSATAPILYLASSTSEEDNHLLQDKCCRVLHPFPHVERHCSLQAAIVLRSHQPYCWQTFVITWQSKNLDKEKKGST